MSKKKSTTKPKSKPSVTKANVKDPATLAAIASEERYKGEAVEPMRQFIIRLLKKYQNLNYSQIYQVAQVLGCISSPSHIAKEGRKLRGVTSKNTVIKKPAIAPQPPAVTPSAPATKPTDLKTLKEVKAFADSLGGIDTLKEAVDALEFFRS